MIEKFRKKPVVIEAVKYVDGNGEEIIDFTENNAVFHTRENNITELIIPTLEGDMKVEKEDWVIKGVKGEFYPCKPNIFLETYEKVIE